MEDDSGSAALLALCPPIISSVMKYLTAKQLNVCGQVCKLWYDLSLTEKRQRKKISWFFFCCSRCCNTNVKDSCDDNCIVYFCKNLNALPIEPAFALIFCTRTIERRLDAVFPKAARISVEASIHVPYPNSNTSSPRRPVIEPLLPYFPANCEIGFCTVQGITGTLSDNSCTKEVQYCPSMTVIYFPDLPGVEIYRFHLNAFNANENFSVTATTGIPEDKQVKCMLFFPSELMSDYSGSPLYRIVAHYLKMQRGQIAIGGGHINHIVFPRHKLKSRNWGYGIAFAGENVKAASIYVSRDDNTDKKITSRLALLKDSDVLAGDCIAFMFTSSVQPFGYYNGSYVKSRIFRKMFPHIPIFGCICCGEIGTNYVPGIRMKGQDIWHHSGSTVFVIISIAR